MTASGELEKKIRSFQTLADIVEAMKFYAGATLRKTQEFVKNIRTYEENILRAMSEVLRHDPQIVPVQQKIGKKIILACGSAQGLCGPFNEKIADVLSEIIGPDDMLFVTGRRLKSFVENRGLPYAVYIDSAVSVNGLQKTLQETMAKITEVYGENGYYTLTLVFTVIKEGRAESVIEHVLPPDIAAIQARGPEAGPPLTYITPELLFEGMLGEFLYMSLYRCYLESLRSENWYRLRSMEGASENMKRRLSELGSLKKTIHQEEITEEMLEIMGGEAAARKQED
jgi:ATP synthase F1 gamma subunit